MQESAPTIIAATGEASPARIKSLQEKGIATLVIEADGKGHVNWKKLLLELGKRQISSILVEGGSAIITSVLQEKLADRIVIVVAPKILGKGIEAVADLGKQYMDEAIRLSWRKVYRMGEDIIIDARPARQLHSPPP
jgi:riboflavin-specific deaminase-like protein